MKGSELFDKEKVHFNLARLSKGGERFEVIIDPDKAVAYKNGSLKDIKEALKYEKIFSDAKKGLPASESSMQKNFNTSETVGVAEVILTKGDIQLSSAYRDSLREAKRRRLIELIHRNAIDPRTNLPHPVTRLENAFAEAKVKIDEHKNAQDRYQQMESISDLQRTEYNCLFAACWTRCHHWYDQHWCYLCVWCISH